MAEISRTKWWKAAALWVGAALLLAFAANVALPYLAAASGAPLLAAMSRQAHYMDWAALVMALVGCVDSALLYRRTRRS